MLWFEIYVAPLGVKEVLVPSWSLANGQDDLIWHKAAKQMDGSYRVTIKAVDHKGEAGTTVLMPMLLIEQIRDIIFLRK